MLWIQARKRRDDVWRQKDRNYCEDRSYQEDAIQKDAEYSVELLAVNLTDVSELRSYRSFHQIETEEIHQHFWDESSDIVGVGDTCSSKKTGDQNLFENSQNPRKKMEQTDFSNSAKHRRQ